MIYPKLQPNSTLRRPPSIDPSKEDGSEQSIARVFSPLQRNSASRRSYVSITPSRAGVDYAALRAAHPTLPTNAFEANDLKSTYKVITQDLTNAGVDQLVTIRGNIVSFLDSTNTTDRVKVRLDSLTADLIPLRAGLSIEGMYFQQIYLTWAATPGAIATLMVIYDPRQDKLNLAD